MVPKVHYVVIVPNFFTFEKICEQYFIPPEGKWVSLFDKNCYYDNARVEYIKHTPESPIPKIILRLDVTLSDSNKEAFKTLAIEKGWKQIF